MNVCDILSSEKNAVHKIIELSKKDGLEHGFTLCKLPDGSLHPNYELHGTSMETYLPLCPLGSKEVGTIHTHPNGVPLPSELDILSSLEYDVDFSCVADEDKKVYCVVFNKDHERFAHFKENLLKLHNASAGATLRGNFIKASEIAEDIEYLMNKALEEGVFRFEVCEL